MLDQLRSELKRKRILSDNIIGKERKYRNAAVFIPLIELDQEIHVLYQVRSEHIRQGGEIGFPGGMMEIEDQGDYEATAIRETVEELGLRAQSIKSLGYLGTLVANSDVTIDVYVGLLEIQSIDDLIFSEEVASVFTVPLKELIAMECEVHYSQLKVQQSFSDEKEDESRVLEVKSLGLSEKYSQPWKMKKRKVYFYRYGGHVIWGMTGEITYEFLKLIKSIEA